MNKTIPLLLAAGLLAACTESHPPTAANTVSWYKSHEAERVEMVASCRDNPGSMADDPDCINAIQAQNQLDGARRGIAPLKALPAGGAR